jgi:hypothetical protein
MAKLATARRSLNCSERFRGKPGIMTGGITLVADGYGHSHGQLMGCAPGLDHA